MDTNRSAWTQERKTILVTLWNEGQTASHIASVFGISRSAVMGAVHRLGLSNRRCPQRAARKPRTPKAFNFATGRPAAKPLAPDTYVYRETIVTAEHERVSFEALEPFDRKCRYAHGDTLPYTYCGAGTVGGTSWCREHLNVVSGAPRPQPSQDPEPLQKVQELEGVA